LQNFHPRSDDAMDQFIKKHQAMIRGRLSGFDRVRFRGTIRMLAAVRGLVLHWYFYFIDSTWGLCHMRIQSWLPFTVHVCVNGREWLCRELEAAGIGFQCRDNCLVDVADFARAQQLLDAQPRAPRTRLLDALRTLLFPDARPTPSADAPRRRSPDARAVSRARPDSENQRHSSLPTHRRRHSDPSRIPCRAQRQRPKTQRTRGVKFANGNKTFKI
jgi:hypothetical protein